MLQPWSGGWLKVRRLSSAAKDTSHLSVDDSFDCGGQCILAIGIQSVCRKCRKYLVRMNCTRFGIGWVVVVGDQSPSKGIVITCPEQADPTVNCGMAAVGTQGIEQFLDPGNVSDNIGVCYCQIGGPRVDGGRDINPGGRTHGRPKRWRNDYAADLAAFGLHQNRARWIACDERCSQRRLEGFLVGLARI